MISNDQIKTLAKKHKINESIIVREYIQLLFLKKLYEQNFSKDIFLREAQLSAFCSTEIDFPKIWILLFK